MTLSALSKEVITHRESEQDLLASTTPRLYSSRDANAQDSALRHNDRTLNNTDPLTLSGADRYNSLHEQNNRIPDENYFYSDNFTPPDESRQDSV